MDAVHTDKWVLAHLTPPRKGNPLFTTFSFLRFSLLCRYNSCWRLEAMRQFLVIVAGILLGTSVAIAQSPPTDGDADAWCEANMNACATWCESNPDAEICQEPECD